MSRYMILSSAALLIASAMGCEQSKLQREMMGDSTWETSAGEEDWNVGRKTEP